MTLQSKDKYHACSEWNSALCPSVPPHRATSKAVSLRIPARVFGVEMLRAGSPRFGVLEWPENHKTRQSAQSTGLRPEHGTEN